MEPAEGSGGGDRHDVCALLHATQVAIAERLRYIRRNHPEGPFTLVSLAEHTGVSKRTLAAAESPDGSNITLETLVKVTYGLGIERLGYLVDQQVFDEVNEELAAVKKLRQGGIRSVEMRAAPGQAVPAADLSDLLSGIIAAATQGLNCLPDGR